MHPTLDIVFPFRWNIHERAQLGGLLLGPRPETDAAFEQQLLACSVRVLAASSNADLYFVGRSPESIHDILSGLLLDTSWRERLQLMHFSMYYLDDRELRARLPRARGAYRTYMRALGLDPRSLARRRRGVAFVDLVWSGATLRNLLSLLHGWAMECNVRWAPIERRLRIVSISHHAAGVAAGALLSDRRVRNVKVPDGFADYLGNEQPKTTCSYTPELWGNATVLAPQHDEPSLSALRQALHLFELGQRREVRAAALRLMLQSKAMRFAWFRQLVGEFRRSAA